MPMGLPSIATRDVVTMLNEIKIYIPLVTKRQLEVV
jgi:hypothetical protein